MCREADSMPVFLKSISQYYEWLHITATADHMDNNVHVNGGGSVRGRYCGGVAGITVSHCEKLICE